MSVNVLRVGWRPKSVNPDHRAASPRSRGLSTPCWTHVRSHNHYFVFGGASLFPLTCSSGRGEVRKPGWPAGICRTDGLAAWKCIFGHIALPSIILLSRSILSMVSFAAKSRPDPDRPQRRLPDTLHVRIAAIDIISPRRLHLHTKECISKPQVHEQQNAQAKPIPSPAQPATFAVLLPPVAASLGTPCSPSPALRWSSA